MAWTSMHFAVGMAGGAALLAIPCLIRRRGWNKLPFAMTLGGLWAIVPDAPRLWREDFPSLPFAATLGAKDFEVWLHSIGDLFFVHRSLDAQPNEYALLGLAMIVALYNLALAGLWWQARTSKTRLPHTTDTVGAATQGGHPTQSGSVLNPEKLTASEAAGRIEPEEPAVVGRIGTG